eukprot:COSAG01_NODE_6061_length_3874_cov_1.743379_7_plen_57_part_00
MAAFTKQYLSAGNHTCQGRAGSRGYEDQDAALLAKLEVDYLKYQLRVISILIITLV